MTSLHELRAIAEQRVADERAAIEQARAARDAARHAAEHARADAEEARQRAERDDRLRVEQARVDAERDARLRVAAALAGERARLEAELDERRQREELELRRAEVARKRPTWMLAVTAVAVASGIALAWFAVQRARDAEQSERGRAQAVASADKARHQADETRARLDELQQALDVLDGKVTDAQRVLVAAQTEADIRHAKQALDAANHERAEVKRLADEARQAEEERIRNLGLHPDKKCLNTALGCLTH